MIYTVYSHSKDTRPRNGEMVSGTFFMFLWASKVEYDHSSFHHSGVSDKIGSSLVVHILQQKPADEAEFCWSGRRESNPHLVLGKDA